MLKHAGSERGVCVFDSCMCHNKNTIGDEGNGSHPIKSTSLATGSHLKRLRALSPASAKLEIEHATHSSLGIGCLDILPDGKIVSI